MELAVHTGGGGSVLYLLTCLRIYKSDPELDPLVVLEVSQLT